MNLGMRFFLIKNVFLHLRFLRGRINVFIYFLHPRKSFQNKPLFPPPSPPRKQKRLEGDRKEKTLLPSPISQSLSLSLMRPLFALPRSRRIDQKKMAHYQKITFRAKSGTFLSFFHAWGVKTLTQVQKFCPQYACVPTIALHDLGTTKFHPRLLPSHSLFP